MKTFLSDLKTAISAAIAPHRKAIASGLVAGIVAAVPLVSDGNVSQSDVYAILGAIAAGAGVTWFAPANKPKDS